jgi:hypothetical protein
MRDPSAEQQVCGCCMRSLIAAGLVCTLRLLPRVDAIHAQVAPHSEACTQQLAAAIKDAASFGEQPSAEATAASPAQALPPAPPACKQLAEAEDVKPTLGKTGHKHGPSGSQPAAASRVSSAPCMI